MRSSPLLTTRRTQQGTLQKPVALKPCVERQIKARVARTAMGPGPNLSPVAPCLTAAPQVKKSTTIRKAPSAMMAARKEKEDKEARYGQHSSGFSCFPGRFAFPALPALPAPTAPSHAHTHA